MPALSTGEFCPLLLQGHTRLRDTLQSVHETAGERNDPVVTWQVIAWVLLALAVNSMAQPSGHFCYLKTPRKYRIYLCISPVLCLADAVSALTSVLITMVTLRTPIVISARYVWFWRSRVDVETAGDIVDEPLELWSPARAIALVLGTLPAFLKLVSFSGVPWSTTWGYMFGLSFVVIESVNVMAMRGSDGGPRSEAAALCLSQNRWDAEVNRSVRRRVENLNVILLMVTLVIMAVTAGCQFALLLWPLGDLLRSSIDDNFGMAIGFTTINQYIQDITTIVNATYFLIAFLVKLINWRHTLLPWLTWTRIVAGYYIINLVSWLCFLHPYVRENEKSVSTTAFWRAVACVGFIIWFLVYGLLLLLCSILPCVGRGLLATPSIHGKTNGREQSNGTRGDTRSDEIDQSGLYCITGFCFQLGVGLMWYAYRYDPRGTSNPPWTSAFG